ncbi:MAG TPA: ABC transporter permease [Candidatus Blautia avistercoris]|uniref:ABC transporter permease n=1 Tax=Blautia sp. An249 TaxID=1965603 RepID=UPI000B3A4333|nr:ABC transporter permease [Blautia sp. An249]OUO79320.1 ABC transporter permease [Blautia sp. An249]HIY18003.1 ABC transporter permease [Candidatus Blautia avistercoris]
MWSAILSPDFFSTILRSTTPILFATLASSIASKSGITNMALEGIMLFSALFGVIFSSLTSSAWMGLIITMVIGGLIGLILAFFVLNLKTDEILAAIAINLTATGGTVLIMVAFSGDRGVSSSIKSISAPEVVIPLVKDIPFLGEVLSGQNILTWIAIIAVILLHLFLYKTPLGLAIRAVGENKDAAESVGISSRKIQYIALVLSGVLASMGGFFLSGGYMNMFTKDMSGGRGFIALAAASMGGNTPVGSLLVSLLFGIAQAFANIMQLTSMIPYEIVLMVPYLATLVGLAIFYYGQKKKKERLSGK